LRREPQLSGTLPRGDVLAGRDSPVRANGRHLARGELGQELIRQILGQHRLGRCVRAAAKKQNDDCDEQQQDDDENDDQQGIVHHTSSRSAASVRGKGGLGRRRPCFGGNRRRATHAYG
jgi:hypothetical protein